MTGRNDVAVGGSMPQRIYSCLQTLDIFLSQQHPVVSSFVVPEKFTSSPDAAAAAGVSLKEGVARILGK